jgi:hypothetical protein
MDDIAHAIFKSSKTTTGVLRAEGTGAVRGERSEAKQNKSTGGRGHDFPEG